MILLTALVCFFSGLAVLAATPWGAWGYSDSSAYVSAARSFLAGTGFSLPQPGGGRALVTLTPPFYALALSLAGWVGADPLDFARWLNALLCAGFLWLSAWGVRRTAGSAAGGLLFCLALACNPVLFANAASAMSEELFFMLAFGGLWALCVPERPRGEAVSFRGEKPSRAAQLAGMLLRRKASSQRHTGASQPDRAAQSDWSAQPTGGWAQGQLLLGAAGLGLAAATRYAGLAFVLAGVVIVFARQAGLGAGGLGRRAVKAGLFGLGAALPVLGWLAWSHTAGGGLGARGLLGSSELALQRGGIFLQATWQELSSWLPYATRFSQLLSPGAKLAAVGLAWAGLLVYLWRADPKGARCPGARRLVLVGLLSAGLYLLFLGASYTSADIQPDLIPRIFSPLYPALVLASLASGIWLARLAPRASAWVWGGLLAAVLVGTIYQAPRLVELVWRGNTLGVGYSQKFWRQAGVFDYLREHALNQDLISNEPALVLLHSGRAAYSWDEMVRGNLQAVRAIPPGSGTTRLDGLLRGGGAVLVIFPERAEEEYGPQARAWLAEWLGGLLPLYLGEDAGVYTIR